MKIIEATPFSYRYPVYMDINLIDANTKVIAPVLKDLIVKLNGSVISTAFACRGTSGLLIASSLIKSMSLRNYRINYVRKHKEYAHSDTSYPTFYEPTELIVVDDFIDTGATMREIARVLGDMSLRVNIVVARMSSSAEVDLEQIFPNIKYLIK